MMFNTETLEMIDTKLSQKELLCPPGWENNNGRQTFFFKLCLPVKKLTNQTKQKLCTFLRRARKNSSSRKRLNPVEQYVIISAFVLLQSYSHRLVCHDLKGAWTLTNRRIAFGLLEAYTNAQVRRNLS